MGSILFIYIVVNVIGIPATINACSKMAVNDEPPYVDLPVMQPLTKDVDW